MITAAEISDKVYALLVAASIKGVDVVRQRHFDVPEEVVVQESDTERPTSIYDAVVFIRIHVQDIFNGKEYEPNAPRLREIRSAVLSAVGKYTWMGTGVNWAANSLGGIVKEQDHNESVMIVMLNAHIRSFDPYKQVNV